jgi:hypothetical protein
MLINVEDILDLPIKTFYRVPSPNKDPHHRFVYLLTKPIVGMNPRLSSNKILIGDKGFIYFLNVLSYSIGYIIEVPGAQTLHKPHHLMVGNLICENRKIGSIKTLHCDEHLTVLENRKNSVYLITATCCEDIPQPKIYDSSDEIGEN